MIRNSSPPLPEQPREGVRLFHWRAALFLISLLGLGSGCSPAARSPDAIRHDSATATAAAIRDVKAVLQGIFEGVRQKGPLNINKAAEEDLAALPGLDSAAARRIVAGRPYQSSTELLERHILSKREYERIASSVVAR